MEDKVLNCMECQQDFLFTAGEQEFYAKKQFQEPKRCATCRTRRKELKAQQEGREEYPSYR